MGRRFAKYEGLGNDFIVIEGPVTSAEAVTLCDRRHGVGADGVLQVTSPKNADADAELRILNADGSVPEMCGNGIRCVALHLALARGVGSADLTIITDAGPRRCVITRQGTRATVRVDMGRVRFIEDKTLDLGDRKVTAAIVDAGNPHAILFGDFPAATLDTLGPRIATDPAFPSGTNVELAAVREGGIDVVVWERGVGRTLACGTGACAVAAAARHKGLVSGPVRVSLPGGDLDIEPANDGTTLMTGPARLVFQGETQAEVEP